MPGATRRRRATGHVTGNAADRSHAGTRDGSARARARGAGIPIQCFREIAKKDFARPMRRMRILNVTQTNFPFLEFVGPPVKMRSLSRQLLTLGYHVTRLI